MSPAARYSLAFLSRSTEKIVLFVSVAVLNVVIFFLPFWNQRGMPEDRPEEGNTISIFHALTVGYYPIWFTLLTLFVFFFPVILFLERYVLNTKSYRWNRLFFIMQGIAVIMCVKAAASVILLGKIIGMGGPGDGLILPPIPPLIAYLQIAAIAGCGLWSFLIGVRGDA